MELQRKESKEFLADLTTRDQRMMQAVLTLVITADSKQQLDSDTEKVRSLSGRFYPQQTVLHLPHGLVGGDGEDVNGQHHIAVQVGQVRHHLAEKVRSLSGRCQLAVLKYQQLDGLNTVLPIGTRKIDAFRTLTTESPSGSAMRISSSVLRIRNAISSFTLNDSIIFRSRVTLKNPHHLISDFPER